MSSAARSVGVARRVEETLDGEVALLDPAQDEIERADDHAQHVVEVMGDAAGELTKRLHLLRLAQLALDLLAPGYLFDQLLVGGR